MFDRNNSLPLSLFLQAERQARLDSLVIEACMRGTMSRLTMSRLAEWLRALARGAPGWRATWPMKGSGATPSASSISSTIVRSLTSASRGVGSNSP